MSDTILSVRNLHKSFGGVRALDGIDLEIEKGEMAGIIGPNGSGKSTLFNCISGVLHPDSGQILFKGHSVEKKSPSEIYQLGLTRTFQNPRLFSAMTVLENLLVPPKGQKGESIANAPIHSRWESQESDLGNKARSVLRTLSIDQIEGNSALNISGGQMKLLEIGRTLMSDPELVLLDEPTAGVLPDLAEKILSRLIDLQKESKITFLIIEHRLDILFKYVNYSYVMHQGKLLFEGSPNEIMQNSAVSEVYLGG